MAEAVVRTPCSLPTRAVGACGAPEPRLGWFLDDLRRPAIAGNQVVEAVVKRLIIHDKEHASATVLATAAVWTRQRALLVQVTKNRIGVSAGRGDADLGVIAIRRRGPDESEFHIVEGSRRGDLDGAGFLG